MASADWTTATPGVFETSNSALTASATAHTQPMSGLVRRRSAMMMMGARHTITGIAVKYRGAGFVLAPSHHGGLLTVRLVTATAIMPIVTPVHVARPTRAHPMRRPMRRVRAGVVMRTTVAREVA